MVLKDSALNNIQPLLPIDFFALSSEIHYAKAPPTSILKRRSYLLPHPTDLLNEEKFCDLYLAWHETGLSIQAVIKVPFSRNSFFDYDEGDSLELFFDTRDVKTSGFATKFCHHFLILPKEAGEPSMREITHFRTEDSHPLCNPEELEVTAHFERSSYQLDVKIPASCLFGYDPSAFDRLGFTYRVNRDKGPPQHFSISSFDYDIEQNPSLWSSLKLTK